MARRHAREEQQAEDKGAEGRPPPQGQARGGGQRRQGQQVEAFGVHFPPAYGVAVFVGAAEPEDPEVVAREEEAAEDAEGHRSRPVGGEGQESRQPKEEEERGREKDGRDLPIAERGQRVGVAEAVAAVPPPEQHPAHRAGGDEEEEDDGDYFDDLLSILNKRS